MRKALCLVITIALLMPPSALCVSESWQGYFDAGKDLVEAGDFKNGESSIQKSLDNAKAENNNLHQISSLEVLREIRIAAGNFNESTMIAKRIWELTKLTSSQESERYVQALASYVNALSLANESVPTEEHRARIVELTNSPKILSGRMSSEILFARALCAQAAEDIVLSKQLCREIMQQLDKVETSYDAEGLMAAISFLSHDKELSIRATERWLAVAERLNGPDHPRLVAPLLYTAIKMQDTNPQKTEDALRRALRLLDKYPMREQCLRGLVVGGLGGCLVRQGKYSVAAPLLKDAIKRQVAAGAGSFSEINARVLYNNCGLAEFQLGERANAEKNFRKALEASGKVDFLRVRILTNMGMSIFADSRFREAKECFKQAFKSAEELELLDTLDAGRILAYLGLSYQQEGDEDAAERELKKSLSIVEKSCGQDSVEMLDSLSGLAIIYEHKGLYDQALPIAQRAAAIAQKYFGKEHQLFAMQESILGVILCELNQTEAGVQAQRHAVKVLLEKDRLSLRSLRAQGYLANQLREINAYDEAADAYASLKSALIESGNENTALMANYLCDLASLQDDLDRNAEAEDTYRQAQKLAEKLSDSLLLYQSATGLADVLVEEKKFNEARTIYEKFLREAPQGSLRAADILQPLAYLHKSNGDIPQAEALLKQVITIREKLLKANDPRIAYAYSRMGHLFYDASNYAKAEEFYRKALRIHQANSEDKHEDTASALRHLANTLRFQSRLAEAQVFYDKAQEVYKNIGRATSAEMALLFEDRAASYKDSARYEEEQFNLDKAILIRTTLKQQSNLDTDEERLATSLEAQGKLSQAIALLEKIAARKERSDNPVSARDILQRLQNLYSQVGQSEQVVAQRNRIAKLEKIKTKASPTSVETNISSDKENSLRERCTALLRDKPQDHLSLATAYNELAVCLHDKKRYSDAISNYLKAVSEGEQHFGKDSPQLGLYLRNTARCYLTLNQLDSAEAIMNRALSISEQDKTKESITLVEDLKAFAEVQERKGAGVKAAELLESVSSIQTRVLGSDNPALITTLNQLGLVYVGLGDFEKSNLNYKRATDLCRRLYGSKSMKTHDALTNQGYALWKAGIYDKAEVVYREALSIQESSSNPISHGQHISNLYNVASNCQYQDKLKEAARLYEQILKEFEESKVVDCSISKADVENRLQAINARTGHSVATNQLLKVAEQSASKGYTQDSIELYKNALKQCLLSKTKSKSDLIICYRKLGELHQEEKKYVEADSYFNEGLKQADSNSSSYAEILVAQARMNFIRSEYDKAIDPLRQALSIFDIDATKNRDSVETCLRLIVDTLTFKDDYSAATPFSERLLALHENNPSGKDATSFAMDLNRLAILKRGEKKSDECIALFKKAIQSLPEDSPSSISIKYNLGKTLFDLHREQEVIDLLEPLQRFGSVRGSSIWLRRCLNTLGLSYYRLAKYKLAASAFEHSASLISSDLPLSEKITVLQNLGSTYTKLNKIDQSIEVRLRALELKKSDSSTNSKGLETLQNELAQSYEQKANYLAALPIRKDTLRLQEARLGADSIEIAETLNVLGVDEFKLEHYPEAHDNYLRALTVYKKSGKAQSGQVATLCNIGTLLNKQKKYLEAENFYKQALELHQTINSPDRGLLMRLLDRYAQSCNDAGHVEKAEELFVRALECGKSLDYQQVDEVYISVISFFNETRNFSKAIRYSEERLALCDKKFGKDSEKSLEILLSCMQTCRGASLFTEGDKFAERLIPLSEKLNISPELRASLLNQFGILRKLEERYTEAELAFKRCREIVRVNNLDVSAGPDSAYNLATMYRQLNRLEDAKPLILEVLQFDQKHQRNTNVVLDLIAVADFDRIAGKYVEAMATARKALLIQEQSEPNASAKTGPVRLAIGSIFLDQGKFEEAETELIAATKALEEDRNERARFLEARALLGFCKIARGKASDVEADLSKSLSALTAGEGNEREKKLLNRCFAFSQLAQNHLDDYIDTSNRLLSADNSTKEALPAVAEKSISESEENSSVKKIVDRIGIVLRSVHARDPRFAKMYFELAEAQLREKDLKAASIFSKQAQMLLPGDDPLLSDIIQQQATIAQAIDPSTDVSAMLSQTAQLKQSKLGESAPEVAIAKQRKAQFLESKNNFVAAKAEWQNASSIWLSLSQTQLSVANGIVSAQPSQKSQSLQDELRISKGLLDCSDAFIRINNNRTQSKVNANMSLLLLERNCSSKDQETAKLLLRCADFFKGVCDYGRARKCVDLAITSCGEDLRRSAYCYEEIAEICSSQGDLENALGNASIALRLLSTANLENSIDYADTLIEQSNYNRALNHNSVALENSKNALAIYEKLVGASDSKLCVPLLDLAELYTKLGDLDKASQSLERAMSISKSDAAMTNRLKSELTESAGRFALLKGNVKTARALLTESLSYRDLERISEDTPNTIRNLNTLIMLPDSTSEQRQKQLIQSCKLADDYVQTVFPQLSLIEQSIFLESTLRPQIDLVLSLGQSNELLHHAYNYLIRWKGLLVYSLRRQTDLLLSQSDRKQDDNIALKIAAARAEKNNCLAKRPLRDDDKQFKCWEQEYESISQRLESIERELTFSAETTNVIDHVARLSTDAFQQLLQDNECFVDLYEFNQIPTTDRHYAAIVLDNKHSPRLLDLGSVATPDASVKDWLQSVTGTTLAIQGRASMKSGKKRNIVADEPAPQTGEPEKRKALINTVWQPIVDNIPKQADRIIVCTDGQLSLVPWNIFSEKNLLIQVNSPREFVTLRRSATYRANSPNRVLLVGDVDFNQSGIDALPKTREEVLAISSTATDCGLNPESYLKERATKSNVTNAMQKAGYIHLATHGYFARSNNSSKRVHTEKLALVPATRSRLLPSMVEDERNLLLGSGLLLSKSKSNSNSADSGNLSAEDLLGFDLSQCNLVTLSACETGRGASLTGQGVLGLRSCFMSANPRTILLSLWKVPDAATALLMQEFYFQHWKNKLGKAAALQAAQEKLRNDPDYSAPVNWAAWILIGEGW